MSIETLLMITTIIGTVAFSVSGALVAIENKLDLFGVIILGTVTACGGGVLRDVMMHQNILMFEDPQVYIHGIRHDFQFHSIVVAIYKSIIFAFFISSIACFKGLKTECDASSIGKASTKAVTASFIAILITDLLLVYMLFK